MQYRRSRSIIMLALFVLLVFKQTSATMLMPREDILRSVLDEVLQSQIGVEEGNQRQKLVITNLDFPISNNYPKEVSLRLLGYSNTHGGFQAEIGFFDQNQQKGHIVARGYRIEQVRVPVLKSRLSRDQRLEAKNISWAWLDKNRINNNTLTNLSNLIGRFARTTIVAGRPVTSQMIGEEPTARNTCRERDHANPHIIYDPPLCGNRRNRNNKNQVVHFRKGNLVLTIKNP